MSLVQPIASAESHQAIVERDAAIAELERATAGVSVCITYHEEPLETLERAWWSVAAQTRKPLEIIVVDDGSSEPLVGRWEPATESYPTRVVSVTNRGLPAARNCGLMLAKGIGFLPLDADDWLAPEYIEKTLPLLLDGADVVLTGLQEHGPQRQGCYQPGYDRPFHLVTWEMLVDEYNRFFYCSLFRASTLREVGGYHPAMAGWPGVHGGYEDWDLWIDLLRRKVNLAAVNDPLFHYSTANPDSMVHKAEQNRQTLVSEIRRHHRLPQKT